jgi:hypothetical protein
VRFAAVVRFAAAFLVVDFFAVAGTPAEVVKSERAALCAVFRNDSRALSADALLAYAWDDAITEPLEASREKWYFPPAVLVKVNFAGTRASCCQSRGPCGQRGS